MERQAWLHKSNCTARALAGAQAANVLLARRQLNVLLARQTSANVLLARRQLNVLLARRQS
jgi:hypothetical protein